MPEPLSSTDAVASIAAKQAAQARKVDSQGRPTDQARPHRYDSQWRLLGPADAGHDDAA